MEILTRVMAKTVYRIDLLDPPLQHESRKKGRRKIFEGKGGQKAAKLQSFSTGWGATSTTTAPKHSHAALERNVSAGYDVLGSAQLVVKRSSLPRSASEPGMLQKQPAGSGKHHHLNKLHSDSCVTSSQHHGMQVQTKVEELIEHKEEENDSIGSLEGVQARLMGRQSICPFSSHFYL